MSGQPHPSVVRALELSRRLLEAARAGDMTTVIDLDAERGQLLREFLKGVPRIALPERTLLDEINTLNEAGLACIEARRREVAQNLSDVGRGRRAVHAYSAVQGSRG
ncbi:MAG: flagellar protein FliT [Steroidobacteraceae bacterium]